MRRIAIAGALTLALTLGSAVRRNSRHRRRSNWSTAPEAEATAPRRQPELNCSRSSRRRSRRPSETTTRTAVADLQDTGLRRSIRSAKEPRAGRRLRAAPYHRHSTATGRDDHRRCDGRHASAGWRRPRRRAIPGTPSRISR